MKYFASIVVLLLLTFAESKGQGLYQTGSIYSYYGAGNLSDFRDPDASAMGLTGIGLSMPGSNLSNPATWSLPVFVSGTGGFELNTISADEGATHGTRSLLNVTHFQLVLPVDKHKFGISLALYPLTQSQYRYQNGGQFDSLLVGPGGALQYLTDYKGSGGLNVMEIGFGWNIIDHLSIGYAPSLIFGKVTRDVVTSYSSGSYYSTHYDINTTNIGMGNRVGMYYEKRKLFNSNDMFSIGVTASFPVTLKSKKSIENYISVSGGTVNEKEPLADGHTQLPLRMGAGIGYWFNNHWMIGTEALYQKWSDYHGIDGSRTAYMKDRWRLGLGGQYLPASSNRPDFLQSLAYRAGFSYDTGYLKLRGKNISSWQISAGLGIPSRGSASSIDIDVSYGFRGTTSHDLVRERIFSLKVSFNLSELMFLKRKIQ